MSDAEYACALSHMSVYEMIKNRKLDGGIILEDDAILEDGFLDFYHSFAYGSYDFIQLDYARAFVWKTSAQSRRDGTTTYQLFSDLPLKISST